MSDTEKPPIGQLFSLNYILRAEPLRDSVTFRRRIGGYVDSELRTLHSKLSSYVKKETGLTVPVLAGGNNVFWQFEKLFEASRIEQVLNLVTLIWRFLQPPPDQRVRFSPMAIAWVDFVSRTLREENLGYTLDEKAGVHFLVDTEFEQNRLSTLSVLQLPRYAGVRDAYESAFRYLDSNPPDTKAAVRALFEAAEILTKLMVSTKNLNKWVVQNPLKQIAVSKLSTDPTASEVIGKLLDGFSEWVDALHNYRHGQGLEVPVAPSMEIAIYAIGTGSSFIRLLGKLDQK